MRRLYFVVRVPDTLVFPIQRIPVQEERLVHMMAKRTSATGQIVDMELLPFP